jgi:predicted nucleotidyltransferase
MAPEITSNIKKLIEACKEFQLSSLYVVGSAARDIDYKKESDIDFLFKRKNTNIEYDILDITFCFQQIVGKKVDMINEKGIRNKYFLKSLLEDRIKLYEA